MKIFKRIWNWVIDENNEVGANIYVFILFGLSFAFVYFLHSITLIK